MQNNYKLCDGDCLYCPINNHGNCLKWEYEDEALALIGKDTNVPASEDDTNVNQQKGNFVKVWRLKQWRKTRRKIGLTI